MRAHARALRAFALAAALSALVLAPAGAQEVASGEAPAAAPLVLPAAESAGMPRPDPRLIPPLPSPFPAEGGPTALQPAQLTLGQGLLYGAVVGCVGVGFLLASGGNVQAGERGRAFAVGCALGAPLGMVAGAVLSLGH